MSTHQILAIGLVIYLSLVIINLITAYKETGSISLKDVFWALTIGTITGGKCKLSDNSNKRGLFN